MEEGFVEKLCFSSSLLPLAGVSGAVCGPAQPADPAGALQLPGAEILLGTAVRAMLVLYDNVMIPSSTAVSLVTVKFPLI